MLFLLFQADADTYALEAGLVAAVLPRVPLRSCPGTPERVAGLLSYRGMAVPVLDFSLLTGRRACADWLSTRILLLQWQNAGNERRVGLMVEEAVRLAHWAPEAFKPAGVAGREGLIVQRVNPRRLLTPEFLPELFTGDQEAAREGAMPRGDA
ncbi:MAG: chemotaxis protein CheW [Kiritimatiellia bacterium]